MNRKLAIQTLARMPELRLKAGISLPPKKHPKMLPAEAGVPLKRAEKAVRAK